MATDGETITGCRGSTEESYLTSIFVLPDYQGKGVGRKSLEALEANEYFHRTRRTQVGSSVTAVSFYRKRGYAFKNGITGPDEYGIVRMEKRKENEMKKRFFIPACVLAAAAVGFVMYVLGHPELSFPWSVRITHILYGLYVDVVILLFVLAFWKKVTCLNVLTLLFELGAVFFLVQSILTVIPEWESNWYLPLALGLNCIALFLNAAQRKKNQKREDERKA